MRTWLNVKCGDLSAIIQQKSRQAGLTVVELMMVVPIIGVLAAIAIPAYDDYVEEARVAQAVSEIGYMSAQIEGYWSDERAYPDGLGDIGLQACWIREIININTSNYLGKKVMVAVVKTESSTH
jgi:prepilin-type N-terminal cleavage/methylation domain-containing protein|tara:strand:+ start:5975 stop:6346 length:372 start_codon:yes stop_codon:yes gene_type:complete